jgi:AP-1-like transcription factor
MTANALQDFLKEEDTFFDSFGARDSTPDEATMSVSDIFSRPIDLGPDESPMSTSFSPDEQQLFHEKRKSDNAPNHPSKTMKADPLAAQQVQKVGKKPGRKADPHEPENKRKAQNRQAQRAFRERKERHLKDLEDRVEQLENEAATTNNENEFLRQQVKRLQGELKKYKNSRFEQNSVSSDASDNGASRSFTFEFPFFSSGDKQSASQKNNTGTSVNTGIPLHRSSSSAQSPTSVISQRRSAGESPASAMSSPFSFRENSASSTHTTPSSVSDINKISVGDIANTETFCDNLSQACGTKDRPVPREGSKSGQSPVVITAASTLPWTSPVNTHKDIFNSKTPSTASVFSPNSFELDFLGEYRDPLFDGEEFSLPELPTAEYSLFDPLENPIANTAFESMKKNPATGSSDVSQQGQNALSSSNDDETVPANDPKLMTCSAVWDRICSHPKFGDIDIDGLCYELRSKAKCSDGGVLLTENDVDKVLESFR